MFENMRGLSLIAMDSHLPDSLVKRLSFPASCSLGSLSLSDDCEGFRPGGTFPSTGTIPILLFDGDADVLLGSDPASLSPQFEPAYNTKSEETGSNTTGYRVGRDSFSGVLGTVESSAVRGSSEEQSSTRGGHVRNRFSGPHRLVHLAFSSIDSEPSGSADDRGDDREKSLSLFFDAVSPSHSRYCCSRPSSSRSSSLSYLSQASVLNTPGGQEMQQTCYESCGASPASISNTQLIAAAKHKQGFVLETFNPRIGQPFSFSFHDCAEQVRLPLTLNHDHKISNQQPEACALSSPAFSSTEADLAIEFPPKGQVMGCDLPPLYSPAIEPSSSSSSMNLPHHLAWLRNITISFCIDQEGFRAVFPTFKLVGYTKPALPIHTSRAEMQKLLANSNHMGDTSIKFAEFMDQSSTDPDLTVNLDVGMAEFMPLKRESFLFNHSTLDTPPSIRRLSVNEDESRDYLSQNAYLSVKSNGGFQVYAVCGSEVRRGCGGEDTTGWSEGGIGSSPIKLEWRFEYAVEDKRKADGSKAGGGEKFLTPLRFSCSPWLLHPRQSRKVTVLSVWRKSIQPRLVAGKVELPIITSPTTPGHQTHNLAGSASPPTSPKHAGALRFPTVTKLWGKWTKSSPYRFDKGSDGSEEDLIPSEDSANRRKRHRPTSAFFSRVSQETERPLQRWDGDRSKSTDAIRPAGRDPRSAIADGERSRARSKTQSLGRGARSEGEDDRVSSRSQDGYSASRSVYRRRPRTAR